MFFQLYHHQHSSLSYVSPSCLIWTLADHSLEESPQRHQPWILDDRQVLLQKQQPCCQPVRKAVGCRKNIGGCQSEEFAEKNIPISQIKANLWYGPFRKKHLHPDCNYIVYMYIIPAYAIYKYIGLHMLYIVRLQPWKKNNPWKIRMIMLKNQTHKMMKAIDPLLDKEPSGPHLCQAVCCPAVGMLKAHHHPVGIELCARHLSRVGNFQVMVI